MVETSACTATVDRACGLPIDAGLTGADGGAGIDSGASSDSGMGSDSGAGSDAGDGGSGRGEISGCSCELGSEPKSAPLAALGLLPLALLWRRRRSRGHTQ